ncbi:MAG: sulfite exporter TauE/SafE family protein [Bdellovibrionia bacterium]
MEWMEQVLQLSPAVMAITVFTASLLGSIHCAGMCGPLQFAVAPNRSALIFYTSGRLISYTLLGVLAGQVGGALLSDSASQVLAWFSGLSFAAILVVFAIRLFKGIPGFHSELQTKLSTQILKETFKIRRSQRRGLFFGLLTPLLPCGWLLSFLLAAGLTEDPLRGGVLMFSFCVGTLPVLGLLPIIKSVLSRKLSIKVNKAAAGLFVFAAFAIVFVRVLSAYQQASCH